MFSGVLPTDVGVWLVQLGRTEQTNKRRRGDTSQHLPGQLKGHPDLAQLGDQGTGVQGKVDRGRPEGHAAGEA